MLVLTRKTNEEIVIGDNIRITIVEVAPGRVKIGVSAPRTVRVDRAEIHEKKVAEQNPQQAMAPEPVNRIAEMLPPEPAATPVATPKSASGLPAALPALPETTTHTNRLRNFRRVKPR